MKPGKGDAVFFRLFEVKPRKGDLKKLEIVRAAIDCIALEGIQGFGLEAIAKRIKSNRSHVFYHFKSADRILEAVIQLITATAQGVTVERLKGAESGPAKVEAYINAAFDWVEIEPRQASVMMAFYHLCTFDPKYRDLHERIRKAGHERIAGVIQTHWVQRETDARGRIASAIQSMLTGELIEVITLRTKKDIGAARHRTVRSALELIEGASAKGRPRKARGP